MNELLSAIPDNTVSLKLDFTGVTNLTQLKEELNNAQKNSGIAYTLDESCTFNYSKGVSIRKGTGGTSDWTPHAQDALKTQRQLVFNNCPIPKRIHLKAHTSQSKNHRCFFSVSVKIDSSVFFLMSYRDGSVDVVVNSGEGLRIDNAIIIVPISTKTMNFDYSI